MSASSIPTSTSSMAELKSFLSDRGIDFRGCLEKSDFVALVEKAVAEQTPIKEKPKAPYPLVKLLGSTVTNHRGETIATDSLAGKIVGLYFSAHWCPPCRQFTPHLAQIYKSLQKSHPGQFEIIFISSDRDRASFNEYYGQMPWLAISFDDRSRAQKIGSDLGVRGIPCLKLYDVNGLLYEGDGVTQLLEDPQGFPWKD